MMNPQIYQQPPTGSAFIATYQEGTGQDDSGGMSFATALSLANTSADGFSPIDILVQQNADPADATIAAWMNKQWVGSDPFVSIHRAKYRIFGYSGTCYCHAYWDEVVYDVSQFGEIILGEISRTSVDAAINITAVDGICLPADFDVTDTTTWPSNSTSKTDWITPEPPDPAMGDFRRYELRIEKLRFSFINGYDPAGDPGYIDGFPTS